MSEWKEYKLGELVVVNERSIGKNFNFKKIEYIDTSSVTENNFDLPFETLISEAPSRAKRLIADGDTIISTVRPIQKHYGFIKKAKSNQVVSTGFAVVSPKKIEPRFLYYFLTQKEITDYLNVIAEGGTTTFPAFKPDELNELSISIPDLPTQTAIAEILSSLDDKIELNNKINLELEQLAQTLFKQWFIDFEFPNENGEPYKSSGGEMVESELGEIPKGWEVKNLDEISNITIGRTPPRQEHHWFSENPNDVKWISIKDMGNCGTYISETSEYLTEEAVTKFKIPTIEKNTVIISFKLTVGRISITTERMLSNEAIAHINLINKELSTEFIYLYLKQFDFDSLGSTSSIATAVNSKSIKAIKIYKPSKDVLKLFQLQVEALFQQLFNNTFEKHELTNLRDTLLPKLISGELAVSSI